MDSQFVVYLGAFLVFCGGCLVMADAAHRRARRIEKEHEALDRELREAKAELEQREIAERMRHDERRT